MCDGIRQELEKTSVSTYINSILTAHVMKRPSDHESGLAELLRLRGKSESATVSPVILVPKGKNDLRVCIDYRLLNEVTAVDHYPLPLLNDIVNMISGCKVFSKRSRERI